MATKTEAVNKKSGARAPDHGIQEAPLYTLIANPTGNELPLDRSTPELRLRWLRATKMLLEALELVAKTEQETSDGVPSLTFLPTAGNE